MRFFLAGFHIVMKERVFSDEIGHRLTRLADDPRVSVGLSKKTLIDTRKFLRCSVSGRSRDLFCDRVDVPALKPARVAVWSVWTVRKHGLVGATVNGYAAVTVLKRVGHVEEVARVDVTPDGVIHFPAPRQETDSRPVLFVPSIREIETLGYCTQREGDWKIEDNDVVVSDPALVN
jgi:hypothetical protein